MEAGTSPAMTWRVPKSCEPVPNIFARSTTDARCSSTASASRTSPRHRAFREAARSIARLYDIAAAPELRERMTFVSPRTGEPVLRAYQIPRSHADLAGTAAVLGDLGGGDVRPDGAHARSRRRLLLRLCGDARACWRRAGRNSPTTWSRSTSTCATTTSMPPMRSCRRRSTAASPRTSRATRRSMPAWSRSATTAS